MVLFTKAVVVANFDSDASTPIYQDSSSVAILAHLKPRQIGLARLLVCVEDAVAATVVQRALASIRTPVKKRVSRAADWQSTATRRLRSCSLHPFIHDITPELSMLFLESAVGLLRASSRLDAGLEACS